MKKKAIPILLVLVSTWCGISEAGTTSWSYPDYSHGSYVPRSGSYTELISGTQYTGRTTFTLDASNVANIADYNNGGNNPGTACDNVSAYLTVDQTAVPDSWDLEIDADSGVTNLPNPKFDFENNNYVAEYDESEVVALGSVVAGTSYYFRTYWNDYRDGDAGDSGNIHAQFAMSNQGFSDYNNCVQSDVVQIINPYGDALGSL